MRLTLTTISSVLLRNFGHFFQGARCSDRPPSLPRCCQTSDTSPFKQNFTLSHSFTRSPTSRPVDVCLVGRTVTVVRAVRGENTNNRSFVEVEVLPRSLLRCQQQSCNFSLPFCVAFLLAHSLRLRRMKGRVKRRAESGGRGGQTDGARAQRRDGGGKGGVVVACASAPPPTTPAGRSMEHGGMRVGCVCGREMKARSERSESTCAA